MPLLRRRSSTPPDASGRPLDRAPRSSDFEVADRDAFTRVLDAAPLPDGDVVVPLARFEGERDALLARPGRLGLRLASHERVEGIAADLPRIARIELEFPKFTDGRHYSTARRLREEHGYAGEVVAVGDVLRDQLLYMHRCGFSAFELAPGLSVASALAAFDETSVHYQAAADRPLPLWKRTQRAPGA